MGIEDLAAGLEDLTRNREALALLILKGPQAVPVLSQVLLGPPSPIPEPRCLAAEGLGAIGGEAAVTALIRVLSLHELRSLDAVLRLAEEAVRNRAAEQLGRLGDRRAVEPLLLALAHDWVREAMRALAAFREERAIPLIVGRLQEPCDRAAAAEATLLFGKSAVPALAATLTERWPAAAEEAPISVERRAEAARLLGTIGSRQSVAALGACLEDPAPRVRLDASLALAHLLRAGTPERALALAAQGLALSSYDVTARCADALVAAGDRSIAHVLAAAAPRSRPAAGPRQPSEDTLHVLAIEVLERMGTPASLDGLVAYLQDSSAMVRKRAGWAMERRHPGARPRGDGDEGADPSSARRAW